VSYGDAVAQINDTGLRPGADYYLPPSAQSFPLSASSPYRLIVGLFTRKAMRIIEDVIIKVHATDQAGEIPTKGLCTACGGAVRNPKGVSVPFNT
jgi:hypothetical protein